MRFDFWFLCKWENNWDTMCEQIVTFEESFDLKINLNLRIFLKDIQMTRTSLRWTFLNVPI